jgi:hypothetical protein
MRVPVCASGRQARAIRVDTDIGFAVVRCPPERDRRAQGRDPASIHFSPTSSIGQTAAAAGLSFISFARLGATGEIS